MYVTFLPEVMDAFKAGGADLAAAGEARWAEWFGNETDDGLQKGPFNTDCLASGYGPPVTRTCTWEPQENGIMSSTPPLVSSECGRALEAQCGDKQGSNPFEANACSTCLLDPDNFVALTAAGCAATDTAVNK